MMGSKRPSDSDPTLAAKLPKLEPGISNDFSGSVKKKLASSSRTGQACDRCKVRKIRCDPRPEGCSPCAQNRTACKTTDRITGKATTRGHAEAMESENAYMRAQLAEMHAQLKEMGVEPRVPPGYGNDNSNSFAPQSAAWPSAHVESEWREAEQRQPSTASLSGYAPAAGLESSRSLPQFKQSSFGDNYLGVSSADSLLSNIKGTSLSVFGHEIDITDFVKDDEDTDDSIMSYNHFLKVALSGELVEPAPLPAYPILRDYCDWYLRSMNPYTMLINKPTLMTLVWRIWNEPQFTPTVAETVCVHMVLATLLHQISVRNGQEQLLKDSHRHYCYALSFFKQLLLSHTWQDVQALALICHHLRNFPKPGAAWMMISLTFLLAIELGFHRSIKAWADTASNTDKLEIEMRKRVFWTLFALVTSLSGKLGRPMPLSMNDIDVEFPEPLDDCLPGEDANLTPFHRCSFQVGIQIAKFTALVSKLYGTLYAVNQTSRSYDDTLKKLEVGFQQWKDELPSELKDPAQASQDDYIFALYLEYWYAEYSLLLHHPAVCRSQDPEVISSNLNQCLSAAQKMLYACNEMRKFRSLDIPWINAVAQIAAIFTTLFIYFQRKDELLSADMTKLKDDMDQWVDLMGEWGQLLGSGDRLKNAIHNIIERSLSNINESIFKRTASQSLAQVDMQVPQESPVATVYTNAAHQNQYTNTATATSDQSLTTSGQAYAAAPTAAAPTAAAYAYSNGTPAPVSQLGTTAFEQQPYSAGSDAAMAPSHAAALQAAASGATSQRSDGTYVYANAQVATNGHQPSYTANLASPHDWRQFTRTYMQQVAPQGEFLNTATTLMALGGRDSSSQGPGQDNHVAGEGAVLQASGASHPQWPGVLVGMQANGHLGRQ